ncbi:hypothetical protein ACU4GD_40120 [Cupriavidus basilensis]
MTWNIDMQGCSVKIQSKRHRGRRAKEFEHGNMRSPSGQEGRLLPGRPDRHVPGYPFGNVPDP